MDTKSTSPTGQQLDATKQQPVQYCIPSPKTAARGRACKKCGADRWILSRNKQQTFFRCYLCNCDYKKSWIKRNSDKAREIAWRDRGIVGMTVERYNQMEKDQDYACAICRKPTNSMVVDHGHKTGVVRGLLCRRCNALAQELDVLRAVVSYVERAQ